MIGGLSGFNFIAEGIGGKKSSRLSSGPKRLGEGAEDNLAWWLGMYSMFEFSPPMKPGLEAKTSEWRNGEPSLEADALLGNDGIN